MLRKNELMSEVKEILKSDYDIEDNSNYGFSEDQHARTAIKIVNRILALIQKEPDANKR